MESKGILVFLIAILSVMTVMALASVSALTTVGSPGFAADITGVTFNDVDIGTVVTSNFVGGIGDTATVRVEVKNTGTATIVDAKVKVELDDEEATTGVFDMLPGKTYSKTLTISLPASIKDTNAKDENLLVTVKSGDGDFRTYEYELTIQRESNELEILSVDMPDSITAGSSLNVDIVLKNRGSHESEDTFVTVSIPALNIQKKVYFSDLGANDSCDECDLKDSAEGIASLKIPPDAKAGAYEVKVRASNGDALTDMTQKITVLGMEQGSDVLVPMSAKDIAAGATATYDLILVNSGNRIAVYNIAPENAQNLVVTVDEPIVTVPADSSRVVKVTVQAGNIMGTFNFGVDVNSQGQLVKRTSLVANVGKSSLASNNVVILTIVLAIIFIVLLVVLIVLLTRKPSKSEEFEESYY